MIPCIFGSLSAVVHKGLLTVINECNKRSKKFNKSRHCLVEYTDGGHTHVCPPPKLPLPLGDLDSLYLICGILGPFGPTRAHMLNGLSIGSAVFARYINVTDTRTDRQTSPRHL